MSRTLNREVSDPDWRIWPRDIEHSDWAEIFGIPTGAPPRLNIDLGFGRGEFITDLARRDPGGVYVGIERSFKRVLKVARRLSKTELNNIRLIRAEIGTAIREMIAENSVAYIWINFPDPWPKRRHERRRIIDPTFVRQLALRLLPRGSLHIATDHVAYAKDIEVALTGEGLLSNAYAPDSIRRDRPELPQTAYEKEWRALGRACFFFHYRRRSDAALLGPSRAGD